MCNSVWRDELLEAEQRLQALQDEAAGRCDGYTEALKAARKVVGGAVHFARCEELSDRSGRPVWGHELARLERVVRRNAVS